MRIVGFVGKAVNGYLNFDLQMNPDLTFVTGINGTGKTSALNSIVSLLLPRLDYLAGDFFQSIAIEIEHEGKTMTLSAEKTEQEETHIVHSEYPNEPLKLREFDVAESIPSHRSREMEAEFYKEFLLQHSDHRVVQFIEGLPTPMYLGLDRRTLSTESDVRRYNRAPVRGKSRRNIFARSLAQSLDEALFFAREKYQEYFRQAARLDAQFREDLVLALIDFPPIAFVDKLEEPTDEERENIRVAKKNLQRLPELLHVSTELISNNVDPIFNFLDEQLSKLNQPAPQKEGKEFVLDKRMEALIDWSSNKTQINKLNRLSDVVSAHNTASEEVFRRTTEFLATINSFLSDSGKRVRFDDIGRMKFVIDTDDEERDIRTLSSGEIQLIVILTHLYFNPEVENANVFIIDEPELSLHVQWQEKFVEGITAASAETQFILATHSPSIILDRVKKCIEITAR